MYDNSKVKNNAKIRNLERSLGSSVHKVEKLASEKDEIRAELKRTKSLMAHVLKKKK